MGMELPEGMEEDALTCINAIRRRHDGAKRNPFSESECGHHYARYFYGNIIFCYLNRTP